MFGKLWVWCGTKHIQDGIYLGKAFESIRRLDLNVRKWLSELNFNTNHKINTYKNVPSHKSTDETIRRPSNTFDVG